MGYLVEGDIAQDEGCLEVSTVPDHLQTLPSPDAVAAIAFEELFLKFSAFWNLPLSVQLFPSLSPVSASQTLMRIQIIWGSS